MTVRMNAAVAGIHGKSEASPNGHSDAESSLQGTLREVHLPLELPRVQWWRLAIRYILARGSALVGPRQTEDGYYKLSKGVAALFISAFLGVLVMGGLGLLWQRDELIRLRTIQEIQDKANIDRDSKIDQAANWGQSAKSDIKYLQGKFDQFALDYAVKGGKKEEE